MPLENLIPRTYWDLIKETLLEIGYIEELRTTWGNKEMLQTFFHNFLIRENTNQSVWLRWQPCNPAFRNFVASQKA